ncbi:MAG: hypothetical protein A3G20_06460 [Acidobacteria bacterium RIFCSPLOWO2_12_FULL_59_11]|nr:MAG: hypothetical protein A3G20_06460 [Acidobacteria bacterium RIFCSPLOWO2_12_FULL_59_11]
MVILLANAFLFSACIQTPEAAERAGYHNPILTTWPLLGVLLFGFLGFFILADCTILGLRKFITLDAVQQAIPLAVRVGLSLALVLSVIWIAAAIGVWAFLGWLILAVILIAVVTAIFN